ncbi:hypothetical protein GHK39_09955, partial [Sinorhizobium medicae]|nr:hypothetical protein [Sinorhizobium medicae]MQV90786.1 hypothetical protein [Sinorhizobium medicae]
QGRHHCACPQIARHRKAPSSGTKQPSDEPPDKHSCQPDQVLGLKELFPRRRRGAAGFL